MGWAALRGLLPSNPVPVGLDLSWLQLRKLLFDGFERLKNAFVHFLVMDEEMVISLLSWKGAATLRTEIIIGLFCCLWHSMT